MALSSVATRCDVKWPQARTRRDFEGSPSQRGPSGSSSSLSTITNQADCQAAGGMWSASTSTCQSKK
jgi:hypothetical protein